MRLKFRIGGRSTIFRHNHVLLDVVFRIPLNIYSHMYVSYIYIYNIVSQSQWYPKNIPICCWEFYNIYIIWMCIYIYVFICHFNVFIIPLEVSPPSSQHRLLNLCSQRAFHIEKGLHQHSIGLDGGNRSFQEIIFWKATRFQHLRCSCIGCCWTWKWNN